MRVLERKVISLGKIKYDGYSRKVNDVTIELELREDNKGRTVFSCCGDIWNGKHTDIRCGGQCLDTIKEYIGGSNDTFNEIYRLWKLYHLNDMHSGTPKQEKALKEVGLGMDTTYIRSTMYLESIGLLNDEYEGKQCEYGSQWFYEPIPKEDLEKIFALMDMK